MARKRAEEKASKQEKKQARRKEGEKKEIDGIKGSLRKKCFHGGREPEERTRIIRALSSAHSRARDLIYLKAQRKRSSHPELLNSSERMVSIKTLE